MKRRQAIRQIGWGISGGIFVPPFLQACTPADPGPEIPYDGTVAIIGAGAAGLFAADILHSKGIKVKIYEAREQVGGRIRSLRNQPPNNYPMAPLMSSDFPIEFGAQMIVGTDSLFGTYYKNSNLETIDFPQSANRYVMDNIAKSESEWGADPDFIAAKNFSTNLGSLAGSSQTVQQAIPASVGVRAHGLLNGQIGNAFGSSNDKIGAGALGEGVKLNPTDKKITVLKTNPMQDALISRFSEIQEAIVLNTPIKSINYSALPIVLTAKDGTTFQADKVIITVPLGILKSGQISFTPGLPGSLNAAMAKFAMGASLRVVIEFKKNFWGDTTGYVLGSGNFPEYMSMGLGRGEFNRTLSVTVNGDKAAQYSALGTGVVDAILSDLDSIYEGQGSLFVRKDVNPPNNNIYVMEDWTKMEYINGGYAYPLAGAKNDDRKALGQVVSDKLYFAGEATDISGQAGMVNGALASAQRAAQEVIDSIKKV